MKKGEKVGLAIFIIVTLLAGVMGYCIDNIVVGQEKGNSLGIAVWIAAPLLTGIIIRVVNKDWIGFAIKPRIKHNLLGYLIAFLTFPILTMIAIMLGMICGVTTLGKINVEAVLSLFMSGFIGAFIKNIFEEFAWRGNLVPFLERTKLGDMGLYACTGLIWGVWHVPYYMFFLPDSAFVSKERVMTTIIGVILVVAMTPLFVELYHITKSVWPCVILHAVPNVMHNILFINPDMIHVTDEGDFFFNPISGVVMIILMFVAGIGLRAYRVTKENRVYGEIKSYMD